LGLCVTIHNFEGFVIVTDNSFTKLCYMIYKNLGIFSAMTVLLLITGCKGDTGPRLSGSMTGFVTLVDSEGNYLFDNSGVSVSAQGTSFSTTTDSSGKWVLNGLTSGSYNFIETKPGYGMSEQQDIQFVGDNGVDLGDINGHIIMAQPPKFFVAIDSIKTIYDSNLYVWFTISGDIKTFQNEYLLVMGEDSSVNASDPSSYLYSDIEIFDDVTNFPEEIFASDLRHSGLTSGMIVYCVAYSLAHQNAMSAHPIDADYSSYFDVTTGRTAYTSLGVPSKVFRVIIP
jgi:hypothetical protein